MRLINRLGALALLVSIVAAACTSSETAPTTDTLPATSTILGEAPTTSPPDTTSATPAPITTTEPPAETANTPPQLFEYAVVAEERARRLAILDPAAPCLGDGGICDLDPTLTIGLPERPHNLAAAGSVAYATHPAAGSISRVDVATGEVLTAAVGVEPHDIKYAPASGALYVADEAGRKVITVDPETLEVIEAVDLPAEPHDLAVAEDAIWVTLNGRTQLARVEGPAVDLFSTGGSPHDLIVDRDGLIWFSNRSSPALNIFDPTAGTTVEAPAAVSEPHHFAIAPDGAVWVSDNGGGAIVGFSAAQPVIVDVGPVPHHVGFAGDTLIVAVSGAGEAKLIKGRRVVASSRLSVGLHGVAVVELTQPLAGLD